MHPRVCTLAGLPESQRIPLYYPDSSEIADLYLSTYQTLCRDSTHVRELFRLSSNEAFFIIDEAHYIKRSEGVWLVLFCLPRRLLPVAAC